MDYVKTLDALLYDFRQSHLDLGQPNNARDRCADVSAEFARYAEANGHAAHIIKGFVTTDWNGKTVVLQGHMAVQLNKGRVVDWTARQFGINENFPRVCSLDEWQADWPPLPKETS